MSAYCPLFEIASFDELPAKTQCALVLGLVRALVAIDTVYLKNHPTTPFLYQAGITYRPQQTVQGMPDLLDRWWDIPMILRMGEGSCEDLASWRVAELQLFGATAKDRAARPFVHSKEIPTDDGGVTTLYHVVVKFPDDTEEDPSLLLGMPPDLAA